MPSSVYHRIVARDVASAMHSAGRFALAGGGSWHFRAYSTDQSLGRGARSPACFLSQGSRNSLSSAIRELSRSRVRQ